MKTVSHLAELRNETNHKPLCQKNRRAEPSYWHSSLIYMMQVDLRESSPGDAGEDVSCNIWKVRQVELRRELRVPLCDLHETSARIPGTWLTRARLASCKRSFTDGCIMSARSDHFRKFDGCEMSPDESHQLLQTCTEGLIISILYFNILLDLIKYNSISQTIIQL
jgi:hypothetical protein